MRPVLPVDAVLVYQFQIRFMYERRSLQGVVCALASQVAIGKAAQLVIDGRQKPVQSFRLSAAALFKELGYISGHTISLYPVRLLWRVVDQGNPDDFAFLPARFYCLYQPTSTLRRAVAQSSGKRLVLQRSLTG